MEPYWYRRIDAVARFPEHGESGEMRTVRLSQEEGLDCDYPEHLRRVADLLEHCGVNDDMGEGSTIEFRVSYRSVRPTVDP